MFAGLLPLVLILAFDAQAGVSPEMQQAIRANTFEVVMKKPEVDPVTYEKALPLDLLPFHERTDKYRSVGTAFSLGHNTYVTAAHVINAAIDSQYGMPELRASDGTVYAIDRITRYSMHEDFVVFLLQNDPAPIGLRSIASQRLTIQCWLWATHWVKGSSFGTGSTLLQPTKIRMACGNGFAFRPQHRPETAAVRCSTETARSSVS